MHYYCRAKPKWEDFFDGKYFKCLQTKDTSILPQSYQKQIISNDYRNATFQIKNQTKYHQVFENKCGFISNLSIIDLLFNLGPERADYLENLDIRIEI